MLLLHRFNHFITQNHLFGAQSRVLAAVSGGRDSVLMAHLLKAGGYPFGVAHCNFRLRGAEALADELFCRELAEQLNVPFHVVRFDTEAYAKTRHVSIQMAARELRYAWFEQLRQQQGYDVIALAHHQNDTIETILLNLVRGTGIAGLHGIRPLNGALARPMLAFTRSEVDEAVQKLNLSYREDSSNASAKYARNKLRLEVIPHLQELNPNLEQTFQRNLQYFNELEGLLQQQAAQARQQVFSESEGHISLSISAIRQLPSPRLLLFGLLKPYGFSLTTVDDLLTALGKHPGRQFASATHQLITDRDRLLLRPKPVDALTAVNIDVKDTAVAYGVYRLHIRQEENPVPGRERHIAQTDAALLRYPLQLRPWQQGDEFCPLGMKGHKKLSDFFIGQKIPLTVKREVPVLVNGNGEIIWVVGYRLDDRYKITPQTKKVTIFELQYRQHE